MGALNDVVLEDCITERGQMNIRVLVPDEREGSMLLRLAFISVTRDSCPTTFLSEAL